MTWDWNHTPEAYANARANLAKLDHDTLAEIWGEWSMHAVLKDTESVNLDIYDAGRAAALAMPLADLTEALWDKMANQRHGTPTHAHACPYGCTPHLIPFDMEK